MGVKIFPCIGNLNLLITLSTLDTLIFQAIVVYDYLSHRGSVLDEFFIALITTYIVSFIVDCYEIREISANKRDISLVTKIMFPLSRIVQMSQAIVLGVYLYLAYTAKYQWYVQSSIQLLFCKIGKQFISQFTFFRYIIWTLARFIYLLNRFAIGILIFSQSNNDNSNKMEKLNFVDIINMADLEDVTLKNISYKTTEVIMKEEQEIEISS